MQMQLVACRVLAARGQLHAVLFTDEQPPLSIGNRCSAAMEVRPALPPAHAEHYATCRAEPAPHTYACIVQQLDLAC